jgi:hypothetical protein
VTSSQQQHPKKVEVAFSQYSVKLAEVLDKAN